MQINIKLIMQATDWNTGDIYEVKDNDEYPQTQITNVSKLQDYLDTLIKQYTIIDPKFFVFKLLNLDDSKIDSDELTALYLCNMPYDVQLLKGEFVKSGQYGQ